MTPINLQYCCQASSLEFGVSTHFWTSGWCARHKTLYFSRNFCEQRAWSPKHVERVLIQVQIVTLDDVVCLFGGMAQRSKVVQTSLAPSLSMFSSQQKPLEIHCSIQVWRAQVIAFWIKQVMFDERRKCKAQSSECTSEKLFWFLKGSNAQED